MAELCQCGRTGSWRGSASGARLEVGSSGSAGTTHWWPWLTGQQTGLCAFCPAHRSVRRQGHSRLLVASDGFMLRRAAKPPTTGHVWRNSGASAACPLLAGTALRCPLQGCRGIPIANGAMVLCTQHRTLLSCLWWCFEPWPEHRILPVTQCQTSEPVTRELKPPTSTPAPWVLGRDMARWYLLAQNLINTTESG